MKELIERLEAASGPDRMIDQDIQHELKRCRYNADDDTCDDYRAPRYTESVDAALTLVPEDWRWCNIFKGDASMCSVELRRYLGSAVSFDSVKASGYSRPTAIAAAALRARMTRDHGATPADRES